MVSDVCKKNQKKVRAEVPTFGKPLRETKHASVLIAQGKEGRSWENNRREKKKQNPKKTVVTRKKRPAHC